MTALVELEERYRNDAAFRAVVDMMVYQIKQLNMSPGELRIAAVFAELSYQAMYRRMEPIRMTALEAQERGIFIDP